MERVLNQQKRAIRCLVGLQFQERCREAFKQLKIFTVVNLYIQGVILHAAILGKIRNRDFHQYNTRNALNFTLPVHHLSLSEKKPSHKGALCFNKLPEPLKFIQIAIIVSITSTTLGKNTHTESADSRSPGLMARRGTALLSSASLRDLSLETLPATQSILFYRSSDPDSVHLAIVALEEHNVEKLHLVEAYNLILQFEVHEGEHLHYVNILFPPISTIHSRLENVDTWAIKEAEGHRYHVTGGPDLAVARDAEEGDGLARSPQHLDPGRRGALVEQ
ncbi:hypothetical protein J6590_056858 [Homalodisca vitripennis]|nr:hypothetical protein J6590_056858 [Homalodisca vitripennis]